VITFALSKGRILEDTRPLLAAAGIELADDPDSSRKLILATSRPDVRIVIVRASDVPTYVRQGGADLGISGKDVLMEADTEGLYEPLDLGIAACRLAVAVPEATDYPTLIRRGRRVRVATKYVQTARAHFGLKGVHVDLIKLYGSMELAPLVGMADAIVDIVSTGGTLRANRLREVEVIAPITARLIVNQAALKTKRDAILPIIDSFARSVAKPAEP
jgi:ATP phosphoribosyltransferase